MAKLDYEPKGAKQPPIEPGGEPGIELIHGWFIASATGAFAGAAGALILLFGQFPLDWSNTCLGCGGLGAVTGLALTFRFLFLKVPPWVRLALCAVVAFIITGFVTYHLIEFARMT